MTPSTSAMDWFLLCSIGRTCIPTVVNRLKKSNAVNLR